MSRPGRWETRLFAFGTATVALHIADDNFVHPESGTSIGDHLISGFVPLAVLALAACLYPRLSGARRGALSLALGVFGGATAIEAVHYAGTTGPSGDDYSGLLAAPAAALLLGLGAATLWRTRRTDGGRTRRFTRRSLLAVAGFVATLYVVLPLGYAYVTTHVGRAIVPAADLRVPYEAVSFTTSDGLDLKGWYVPSRNGAAVIAFPGRKGPQRHTRMLARHGYGVLLFDRRGEGASDGDPNAWGWGGERDIMAAIAFLQRRPDVDPSRIGGLGLSVGGELMLQAAAESDRLKAVVSEGGGFRSIREIVEMPGKEKWPALPFHAVLTAATAVFSNERPPTGLTDLVPRIAPRPILLIHAGIATEILNREFHAAAGQPKTLWEIPEATHTGGLTARPQEYERRVVGFFDEALLR